MSKTKKDDSKNVFWVDLSDLLFDPENPRLPDDIDGNDDNSVFEWMLRQGDSIELISSIGATGYSIAEPLLIIKHNKIPGKYIVVEGNRRLAALRLLNNPSSAPIKQKSVDEAVNNAIYRPTDIPTILYKEREEAFAYLGYRHIAGVKAWGPLQKAKYVRQLFEYYNKTSSSAEEALKRISTVAATKPYAAKKSLTTLALYELAKEKGYWDIKNISSSSIEFSVLGTALNHNAIVNFIGLETSTDYLLNNLEEERVAELFQWLFAAEVGDKSRVGESRQLSTLAKVVSTPQALEAFRAGRTLQDASIYTDEVDETFQTLMGKASSSIDQVEDIIGRVTPSDVHLDMLRDMQKKVRRIAILLEENREENKI